MGKLLFKTLKELYNIFKNIKFFSEYYFLYEKI